MQSQLALTFSTWAHVYIRQTLSEIASPCTVIPCGLNNNIIKDTTSCRIPWKFTFNDKLEKHISGFHDHMHCAFAKYDPLNMPFLVHRKGIYCKNGCASMGIRNRVLFLFPFC